MINEWMITTCVLVWPRNEVVLVEIITEKSYQVIPKAFVRWQGVRMQKDEKLPMPSSRRSYLFPPTDGVALPEQGKLIETRYE